MINIGVDILESELIAKYPEVLDILLIDHTTNKNIFWATKNYEHLGPNFNFKSNIQTNLITGDYGSIIMPRVHKDKILQLSRSKEMAEVFTPSWICNSQNNLIDNSWFGYDNAFNTEIVLDNGVNSWIVNEEEIKFSENKSWKHYVRDSRLEMACGEAPYITSRYDTTTGEFIPIKERVGLLDRKLRVINENVDETGEWLDAAQTAFKNIYAFEWQGDNLLLAREAMLITFIENFQYKFNKEPLLKSIKYIAYIISWNIWQMDGLKGTVPNTCVISSENKENLFGEIEVVTKECEGCSKNNIKKHNGTYCIIKDWKNKDLNSGSKGRIIKFVDLLK